MFFCTVQNKKKREKELAVYKSRYRVNILPNAANFARILGFSKDISFI